MDDRYKAILLKVRKKAVAPFSTVKKITAILTPLGWTVTPVKAFVKVHTKDWASTPEGAEALRHKYLSDRVATLPQTPVVGQQYVVALSDVKPVGYGYGFDAQVYQGASGIRVTSPRSETREFIPSEYDMARGGALTVYDVWRWLWETSLLAQIAQVFDTPEHVPAEQRTRENTGTCPICFGNYKLANGRLVLHGFRRPGWGSTEGKCWATYRQPLELSVDTLVEYLGLLDRALSDAEKRLHKLTENPGRLTVRYRNTTVTSDPGDPEYPKYLESRKNDIKMEIRGIKAEEERYNKVVRKWAGPYPLPGDPQWKYHSWD